jgi:adenylylsulfate kinase
MIVWITGQPNSGKTTIAKELVSFFKERGISVIHIDGDELRKTIDNFDYSESGRIKNVDYAQKISLFLSNIGYYIIVSMVSPYRIQRDSFKEKSPNIKEIYLHSKRVKENRMVLDYEQPVVNFISIDTDENSVTETCKKITEFIGV